VGCRLCVLIRSICATTRPCDTGSLHRNPSTTGWLRFCNIDYDREIAIAAFVEEEGEGGEEGEDGKTKMTGVGRLIIEPDEETAESRYSQIAGRGMESAANCWI